MMDTKKTKWSQLDRMFENMLMSAASNVSRRPIVKSFDSHNRPVLLATGAVAVLVVQPAAAQQYSIPTTSDQAQTCDTAGSASPISTSCNGTSDNNIANSPSPPVEFECPTFTPFTFSLVGTTCNGIAIAHTFAEESLLASTCIELHGQPSATPVGGDFSIQCSGVPAIAV